MIGRYLNIVESNQDLLCVYKMPPNGGSKLFSEVFPFLLRFCFSFFRIILWPVGRINPGGHLLIKVTDGSDTKAFTMSCTAVKIAT